MGLSRTTASRIAETLRPFSIVEIRPIALRTYLSLLTVSTQLRQHGVERQVSAITQPSSIGTKKSLPLALASTDWQIGEDLLTFIYVGCLRSFLALHDLELDRVAFLQAFIALA